MPTRKRWDAMTTEAAPLKSARARWLLVATVLGSSMAFLDGTVVNVALPTIGRELGGGLTLQQWVLDGYLLTLGALLLAGGAATDRFGRRRVFQIGLVAFTLASAASGLAPTGEALVLARIVQGVGAAALVPGSLALINEGIEKADRGKAIGLWAGMSGVSSALGPFLGGWLVDAVSWRWVFWINIPLAAVAFYVTTRHLQQGRRQAVRERFDLAGAITATLGLTGIVYALIEGPAQGWATGAIAAGSAGVVALGAFVVIEGRVQAPLLPKRLFASGQFTGVNLVTLAVYGAFGAALFLLSLQLQQTLGYSALAAGAATVPATIIMLLGSPVAGGLVDRFGPRIPMTVGPLLVGTGLALMALVAPGSSYVGTVLPAVIIFGVGMATLVAPLTTAVMAAVPEQDAGTASGVNNAVSRVASLLAVAVLPAIAGIHAGPGEPLGPGFARAMLLSGAIAAVGGLIAALTVRSGGPDTDAGHEPEPEPDSAVSAWVIAPDPERDSAPSEWATTPEPGRHPGRTFQGEAPGGVRGTTSETGPNPDSGAENPLSPGPVR